MIECYVLCEIRVVMIRGHAHKNGVWSPLEQVSRVSKLSEGNLEARMNR